MTFDNIQATVDPATSDGAGELSPVTSGPDTNLGERTQRGMVSAEWTVGIIAAIAIAGVLLAVVTAGPVEKALLNVVLAIINAFTRGL